MRLPLVVLKIAPLEWALVPFRSKLSLHPKYYFLCFELTVVAR